MIGREIHDLRASRAKPRLIAGQVAERREVYDAALQQFEELLRAADGAGMASKPILLFYALSQAGRAITADLAAGDWWKVGGHGLKFSTNQSDVLLSACRPDPNRDRNDSFGALLRVLGCPPFKKAVPIAMAWRANVDLADVNFEGGKQWRGPLIVRPRWSFPALTAQQSSSGPVSDIVVEVPWPNVDTEAEAKELLAAYPTTAKATISIETSTVVPSLPTKPIVLRWSIEPDEGGMPRPLLDELTEASVDGRAETFFDRHHFLIPAVAPGFAPPSIVSWWLLLFGLSNLARYEPAAWRRTIDPSTSVLAVPLERAMDQATLCLPARVRGALSVLNLVRGENRDPGS